MSADGLCLSCQASAIRDTHPQKPNVILVHGLGDHSRALPYRVLAEHLEQHDVRTFGFDWRGHGRSEGPRAYTPSWGHLRDDLSRFVSLVRGASGGGPVFVIGLSLGGLLVLDQAITAPAGLAGVVAAAPALDASGAPWLVRTLLPWLSRLAPRLPFNPGLDLTRISRDVEAVREYIADALFQVRTTPRMAAEVLVAMSVTLERAADLQVPVLMLHGGDDTIVRPACSEWFYPRVAVPDKALRLYPGGYHNLFIDHIRGDVFEDITRWLQQHSRQGREMSRQSVSTEVHDVAAGG